MTENDPMATGIAYYPPEPAELSTPVVTGLDALLFIVAATWVACLPAIVVMAYRLAF